MKSLKLTLFLAAAALLVFGLSGTALAFHGGGVAHCDGCHTMHNSADNPAEGTTNNVLLKGTDASSTCLNCHNGAARYHVASSDGSNTNSGGDFYWVKNPYTVVVRGTPNTYGGENAGHNIVALDFGFVADSNPSNAQAPGGTYTASKLGCTSCHDAHGQVLDGTANGQGAIEVSGSYDAEPVNGGIRGNFRLLGDQLYEAGNHTADGYGFSNPAPVAEATSYAGESVDFGQGMSEWCANCHGLFVNDSHKHPAGNGEHLNGYASNYNSYVASGNFGGSQATAYSDLVPFERGTADHAILNGSTTEGPRPTETTNVMCLTCHRAHASAHNNAGRWDFEVEFIAESHAIVSPDVPATAAPYYENGAKIDVATVFGHNQRSLCNKCHVQD